MLARALRPGPVVVRTLARVHGLNTLNARKGITTSDLVAVSLATKSSEYT